MNIFKNIENYSHFIFIGVLVILSITIVKLQIDNGASNLANKKLNIELQESREKNIELSAPKKSLRDSEDYRMKLKEDKVRLELEKSSIEHDLSLNAKTTLDVESVIRCKREFVLGNEEGDCDNEDVFSNYAK